MKQACSCGRHRSQFECDVAHEMLEAEVEFGYEIERVRYNLPKIYIPDFTLASGVIVEAKGYFKPADRTKMEAVVRDNPDRDVRMLFQRASNKLNRNSKVTYAQWCERRNIQWAQGPALPRSWR